MSRQFRIKNLVVGLPDSGDAQLGGCGAELSCLPAGSDLCQHALLSCRVVDPSLACDDGFTWPWACPGHLSACRFDNSCNRPWSGITVTGCAWANSCFLHGSCPAAWSIGCPPVSEYGCLGPTKPWEDTRTIREIIEKTIGRPEIDLGILRDQVKASLDRVNEAIDAEAASRLPATVADADAVEAELKAALDEVRAIRRRLNEGADQA